MAPLNVAYGWTCALDFMTDQERPSLKCMDQCGIVEVVTISRTDFEALIELAGIRESDIVASSVGPMVWQK